MSLHLVPDPEEELLELTCGIQAFHDTYSPQLPYYAVSALQAIVGTEPMETCSKCRMRKYAVQDHVCLQCHKPK